MDLSSAAKAAINEAWAGQPDCLPLLKVEGDVHGVWDRGRIEQLLQNLIGNAHATWCQPSAADPEPGR